MSTAKPTSQTHEPRANAPELPFMVSADWFEPLMASPAKYYAGLMSFMADRLRAHADFLQDLAKCESLPDLTKHQADYLQSSWSACSKEALKTLETARESLDQAQGERPATQDAGKDRHLRSVRPAMTAAVR